MNYLLSRTSGKAREVIENYQGLPNSCQLALEVLKQRFGQTAMIVETLKSSVITGPRLRSGDTAALQALSDKVQSCCWAMIELNSNELDCTTNLRQIYDRLPDPLRTRWRKVAKSYREKNNGKEPTLMELSRFISAESLTESDPVYGKCTLPTAKCGNPKKVFLNTKQVSAPRIATLATDILTEEGVIGKGSVKSQSSRKISSSETNHWQAAICKVCKGNHGILKCPVFPSKSLNWVDNLQEPEDCATDACLPHM